MVTIVRLISARPEGAFAALVRYGINAEKARELVTTGGRVIVADPNALSAILQQYGYLVLS